MLFVYSDADSTPHPSRTLAYFNTFPLSQTVLQQPDVSVWPSGPGQHRMGPRETSVLASPFVASELHCPVHAEPACEPSALPGLLGGGHGQARACPRTCLAGRPPDGVGKAFAPAGGGSSGGTGRGGGGRAQAVGWSTERSVRAAAAGGRIVGGRWAAAAGGGWWWSCGQRQS